MIVGHEEVRHALSVDLSAVSLLEGPEGIGKRLVAREVAERLAKPIERIEVGNQVCSTAVNGVPCGPSHQLPHQPSCDMASVAVVEYIAERCSTKAFGGGRVVSFDAGLMGVIAANRMLKLLEEPPPDTYFVLWASVDPLPTIRSRAQRYRLHPLHDEDIMELVTSWGVPPERAKLVVELAGGLPGRAATLTKVLRERGAVLQLLRASAESDRALLSNAIEILRPKDDGEWAEVLRSGELGRARETCHLFALALTECRTGTRRAFTVEETYEIEQLSPTLLDRCIDRLNSGASPILAIRSVCEMLSLAARRYRRALGSAAEE